MRLSFRLAELHNYTPDLKKRPGVIKAICDNTGLDRHQVAALLRNEVKHIPLDALSRLCDYLVAQGLARADELPGALFAVEAEHFWELLARRRRLELCVGMRRESGADWPDAAWVVASDSVLIGELLNGISSLGGRLRTRETQNAAAAAVAVAAPALAGVAPAIPAPLVTTAAPIAPEAGVPSMSPTGIVHPSRPGSMHPESLTQSLVWSPMLEAPPEVHSRAAEVYQEFIDSSGDKALICIGSTKSNPVAEWIMASAFNLNPFESQDEVAEPAQRGCPLYIRYRPTDPHPPSCWAGQRLSRWEATEEPGIYYELPNGQWACAPCDGKLRDAAYVFYTYRESQGWLEMALGGFSGRATRLLARTIMSRAEEFWPPVDVGYGVRVGAFVVKFTLPTDADQTRDLLRTDLFAHPEIIKIDAKVLDRRLNPSKAKTKRSGSLKAK